MSSIPFEALLAVLRLESHRAKCMVIAEDLGTAPEGFSDAIMASGLLSYRVLSFERGEGRRPSSLRTAYPRQAVAVITTHDLPTFVGWWRGLDIDLRQTIGIYDPETAERERAGARRRARPPRRSAARRTAASIPGAARRRRPSSPSCAIWRAPPACSTAIQYEDVLGELNQPNLPGHRRGASELAAQARRGPRRDRRARRAARQDRGRDRIGRARPPRERRRRSRRRRRAPPTGSSSTRTSPSTTRRRSCLISPGSASATSTPRRSTAARPGSTHGYDIVDHGAINPELGGEEGFYRLSDALREHGLGLVLDIVPNHMGVGGADNPWWLSVLEWGELSPHAEGLRHRLGAARREPQARGALPRRALRRRARQRASSSSPSTPTRAAFSVWHYEHRFPICPLSYPIVLDRALVALGEIGTEASADGARRERAAAHDVRGDRSRSAAPASSRRARRSSAALREAMAASPGLRVAIERAVQPHQRHLRHSRELRHAASHPRGAILPAWPIGASRRATSTTAASSTSTASPACASRSPTIFEQAHRTVFRLVREGRVDGLRIDHVDGLADPAGLSARAAGGASGPASTSSSRRSSSRGEKLRLVADRRHNRLRPPQSDRRPVRRPERPSKRFDELYRRTTETERGYHALLRAAKTEILETSFASELEVLVSDLKRIADADRHTRDLAVNAHPAGLRRDRRALPRLSQPISTTSDADAGGSEARRGDRRRRRSAAACCPTEPCTSSSATCSSAAFETEGPGRPDPELARRFRRRFQQLTGPVMAKSLEDTLFYRYVRLSGAERGRRRSGPFRRRRSRPSTKPWRSAPATGRTP